MCELFLWFVHIKCIQSTQGQKMLNLTLIIKYVYLHVYMHFYVAVYEYTEWLFINVSCWRLNSQSTAAQVSSWTARLRPDRRSGPRRRTAGCPAAAARPGIHCGISAACRRKQKNQKSGLVAERFDTDRQLAYERKERGKGTAGLQNHSYKKEMYSENLE